MTYGIYNLDDRSSAASKRAEEYRQAAERLTALTASFKDRQVVATLMTVASELRSCAERWNLEALR